MPLKKDRSERSISITEITSTMTDDWWKGMPKEIELDLEVLSEPHPLK